MFLSPVLLFSSLLVPAICHLSPEPDPAASVGFFSLPIHHAHNTKPIRPAIAKRDSELPLFNFTATSYLIEREKPSSSTAVETQR